MLGMSLAILSLIVGIGLSIIGLCTHSQNSYRGCNKQRDEQIVIFILVGIGIVISSIAAIIHLVGG